MTRAGKKNIWRRKGVFKVILSDIGKKKNQGPIPLCGAHNKKLQAACVGGIPEEHDINTQAFSCREISL